MCGIFGVYSKNPLEIVPILHDGLLMLQHRGQEGTGVALSDGQQIIHERRLAKEGNSVRHFFGKFNYTINKFLIGIGHNRYSTAGSSEELKNIQPLLLKETRFGDIAVAHNGTIPNASVMKKMLGSLGDGFSSDSDTEIILKYIVRSKRNDLIEAIIDSLERIVAAYALVFLVKDKLIAVRDPMGFRPLALAEFNNGYLVASETCAFDGLNKTLGVRFLREIEPGELIIIDKNGLKSIKPFRKFPIAQCIFELIYFARPDSRIFGWNAYDFRIKLGYAHAKEHPIRVDAVIAVPDSANYFGDGHAEALGVPHRRGLVRNHYTGRTFIDPIQSNRSKGIRLKLNPIPGMIEGLEISIDDDSIVRGNTSGKIVRMIRNCKPKSITFSVSCPPIISYCPYGIDIKGEEELIASKKTVEEIRQFIEADDLRYLTLRALKELGGPYFCYGCFENKYPF